MRRATHAVCKDKCARARACADGRAGVEQGARVALSCTRRAGPHTRYASPHASALVVCGRGSGCQSRGAENDAAGLSETRRVTPPTTSPPSAGNRQRGVEPVLAAGESCLSAYGQRGTTGPHTLRRCGFCAPCAGPYEGAPWRPETSCRPAGPAGTQRRAS
jgi:hypothetical protein